MPTSRLNFALLVLYVGFAGYILGVDFLTKLKSLLVEKFSIDLKGLGHAILGNFSTDQMIIELTKI